MKHEVKQLDKWFRITFIEWAKAVWMFSEEELSEKDILWMYPKALNQILKWEQIKQRT